MTPKIAFFIDVDNTLINNDQIKEEIKKSLMQVLGEKEANHFWQHHDEFRSYEKFVDFPKVIRQYCSEKHEDRCELVFNKIFDSIGFAKAMYPNVKEVISHLQSIGQVNLFTEGDSIYQRMKIEKSGLSELVDAIFLFEHKMDHVKEVVNQFEDFKKIFIDDRAMNLVKIKAMYPEVYIIEVAQGHYSTIDHVEHAETDEKVDSIMELLQMEKNQILS